jgi:hypothetical protein
MYIHVYCDAQQVSLMLTYIRDFKIYYLLEHESFVKNLSSHFSKMTIFSSKSCSLEMVCRIESDYYLNGIKM